MTQENPLNERDQLVLVLARWLERNDYLVAANLEERTKPPSFGGHRPDVYASQMGRRVLGEAELCERLHDEQTRERWRAFTAEVSRLGSHLRYELHIIVPSSCLEEAKQQAAAWGVDATFHTEELADWAGRGGGQ